MSDPANYVDHYSEKVKEFVQWRTTWERTKPNSLSTSLPYSDPANQVFKNLEDLFKTQNQINIMMLHELDKLRRQG